MPRAVSRQNGRSGNDPIAAAMSENPVPITASRGVSSRTSAYRQAPAVNDVFTIVSLDLRTRNPS